MQQRKYTQKIGHLEKRCTHLDIRQTNRYCYFAEAKKWPKRENEPHHKENEFSVYSINRTKLDHFPFSSRVNCDVKKKVVPFH